MATHWLDGEARAYLSQSLGIVEAHKARLTAAMQERLTAAESPDEPFGQADVAAMLLVDMLIDQVRHLLGGGALRDIDRARAALQAESVDGRHYSRFGESLVPAMRELFGPTLPREVPAIWCDAFWFTVRALQSESSAESAA